MTRNEVAPLDSLGTGERAPPDSLLEAVVHDLMNGLASIVGVAERGVNARKRDREPEGDLELIAATGAKLSLLAELLVARCGTQSRGREVDLSPLIEVLAHRVKELLAAVA